MCRIGNHLLNVTSQEPITNKKFHHFSGIYKGGKPITLGYNHDRCVFNNQITCATTHAEMDALFKLLKVAARTAI